MKNDMIDRIYPQNKILKHDSLLYLNMTQFNRISEANYRLFLIDWFGWVGLGFMAYQQL